MGLECGIIVILWHAKYVSDENVENNFILPSQVTTAMRKEKSLESLMCFDLFSNDGEPGISLKVAYAMSGGSSVHYNMVHHV